MHSTIEGQDSSFDVWKNARPDDTWNSIVLRALVAKSGTASLAELYGLVQHHPRALMRQFWKDKVRQVLERSSVFTRIAPGLWSFASEHSVEQLVEFAKLRSERYPKKGEPKS